MASERVITASRRRAGRAALAFVLAIGCVGLAALAVTAAPLGGPAQSRGGTSQLSIPMPPSGVLRILNAGGRVIVHSWDGEDVLLTITKEAVVRGGRSLAWLGLGGAPGLDDTTQAAIDAIEPLVRRGEDSVEVSTLAHGPTENVLMNYNYEVRLPRGSALAVSNGSGPVRVNGVEGGVNVSTGNGDIRCDAVAGDITARAGNGAMNFSSVSGPIDARTANGAILVDNRMVGAVHPVTCHTDNGPIRLRGPQRGAYAVNATTLNGWVDAERADGAVEATLHSLNGSIVVDGL